MKNKPKKSRRRRIDVNVQELDQIVDRAREAPLSDTDYDKLKTALHALIERLLGPTKTEKLAAVFADENSPASAAAPPRAESSPGHGRNGALSFTGARKVTIAHQHLAGGDRCPRLRPRQGLRAEGAQGAGADRGPGTAGRNHL